MTQSLVSVYTFVCGNLRCCDDLISGSPDQQDWSLESGGRGREGVNVC